MALIRKFFLMVMMLIFLRVSYSSSSTVVNDDNDAAAANDIAVFDHNVKGCPFTSIYSFGGGGAASSNAVVPNSDGLLIVDYLASALHLPSPTPYYYAKKDVNNGATLGYGVNFAVDGATALNASFLANKLGIENMIMPPRINNNSLGVQLDSFETHLNSICSSGDHQDCSKKKLGKSIFLVEDIGSSDYNNAFFQSKQMEEVIPLVSEVVRSIKDSITRLIDAGAVNIIVSGSLPLGCLPSYLAEFHSDDTMNYDSKKCLRSFDTFSRLHNDHLRQALWELRSQYPRVNIVYADYYKAFMTILYNPIILGFEKSSSMKACCGSGDSFSHNFSMSKRCGDEGVTVCSDPKKYIHWDGFHVTQEVQKYMVEGFISGSFVYPKLKLPQRWHCLM